MSNDKLQSDRPISDYIKDRHTDYRKSRIQRRKATRINRR